MDGVALIGIATGAGVLAVAALWRVWPRLREAQRRRSAAALEAEGRHVEAAAAFAALGYRVRAADNLARARRWEEAARAYADAGDFERSATMWKKAGDFEMAALAAKRAGNLELAARLFHAAGRVESAAALLVEMGRGEDAAKVYVELGDIPAAVAALRKAGKVREALGLQAQLDEREGRWADAARAREQRGEHEQAAQNFERAGMMKEASAAWEAAGEPSRAAQCAEKAGEHDRASSLYEKAGDVRGAALCALRAGQAPRAIELLRNAGEWVAVAHIYRRMGQLDKALDVLERVEASDAQFDAAQRLRGQVLEQAGQLDEARQCYAAVVRTRGVASSTRDLLHRIIDISLELGDLDTARLYAERMRQAGMLSETVLRELSGLAQDEQTVAEPAEVVARTSRVRSHLFQHPRYELERELGRGAYGIVYLARDRTLGRPVVVKVLRRDALDNEAARKYFVREARTAALLNHPNIVTVYDAGDVEGIPFIAMEYVEGQTLERWLRKRGRPLSLGEVVSVADQLGAALDYAHERKVIHRDLKLDNVMRTPDGTVKLMDFGLAKAFELNPERSVLIAGTPLYMAPEQIEARDVDARTDVYAFGVMLFRLLTFHYPFEEGNILLAHRTEAPPSPRQYDESIPEAVAQIVLRCLEKDPRARFASAGQVADHLAAAAGFEPV